MTEMDGRGRRETKADGGGRKKDGRGRREAKGDRGGRKKDGRGRRDDPGKSVDRFTFSISLSKLVPLSLSPYEAGIREHPVVV